MRLRPTRKGKKMEAICERCERTIARGHTPPQTFRKNLRAAKERDGKLLCASCYRITHWPAADLALHHVADPLDGNVDAFAPLANPSR